MTPGTLNGQPRVRRCAVCKIDLKGRFVFLDDGCTTLFGQSAEDLYGKPFIEFVAEPHQEHVRRILSQRNHYESFYESTQVSLIGSDRRERPATVIISLNYIAGNPVNFQIIVSTDPEPEQTLPAPAVAHDWDICVQRLLLDTTPTWTALAQSLRLLTGATWAIVYRAELAIPVPIACSHALYEQVPGADLLPRVTAIHTWTLEQSGSYKFTDHDQVRVAIELEGFAPNEYLTTLSSPDGERILVRLQFDVPPDHEQQAIVLNRAELTIQMFRRLMSNAAPEIGDHALSQQGELLHALDRSGLGAAIIGPAETLVTQNATLGKLLSADRTPENWSSLVDLLRLANQPETITSLEELLPVLRNTDVQRHDLLLQLPGGVSALLVISRITEPAGSWLCILGPLPASAALRTSGSLSITQLGQVVTALQSPLLAANQIVDKLAHEYYERLERNGNFYLLSLGEKTHRLAAMLGDLEALTVPLADEDPVQLLDVHLLVGRLTDDLSASHAGIAAHCEYGELPKLAAPARRLTTALRHVVSNCLKFAGGPTAHLQIRGEIRDRRYYLTISDQGIGIAEKYLGEVGQLFFRVPDPTVQCLPGRGVGLAAARLCLESFGGTLTISAGQAKGVTYTVTVPVP